MQFKYNDCIYKNQPKPETNCLLGFLHDIVAKSTTVYNKFSFQTSFIHVNDKKQIGKLCDKH